MSGVDYVSQFFFFLKKRSDNDFQLDANSWKFAIGFFIQHSGGWNWVDLPNRQIKPNFVLLNQQIKPIYISTCGLGSSAIPFTIFTHKFFSHFISLTFTFYFFKVFSNFFESMVEIENWFLQISTIQSNCIKSNIVLDLNPLPTSSVWKIFRLFKTSINIRGNIPSNLLEVAFVLGSTKMLSAMKQSF